MAMSNWLRALNNPFSSIAKTKTRRRCRPALETLEDRSAPAVFTGTSNASSGAGTLRQAIQSANVTPGADTISINLGAGLHTISLTSALPAITGPVAMDGSQSGLPKLELNGAGA